MLSGMSVRFVLPLGAAYFWREIMYEVIYTYTTGFDGQKARGDKRFATEGEAMSYARRLESTPGYSDVTVWHGSKRIG